MLPNAPASPFARRVSLYALARSERSDGPTTVREWAVSL